MNNATFHSSMTPSDAVVIELARNREHIVKVKECIRQLDLEYQQRSFFYKVLSWFSYYSHRQSLTAVLNMDVFTRETVFAALDIKYDDPV